MSSEPATNLVTIIVDESDVCAMAEELGLDEDSALAAARRWASAITEYVSTQINERLADLLRAEAFPAEDGADTPEQIAAAYGVPSFTLNMDQREEMVAIYKVGYYEGLGDVGMTYDDDPSSARSEMYDLGRSARRREEGLVE